MHTFKRERAHQEAAAINETFDAPGVMSADDVMAFYKRHPDYAPGGYWERHGVTVPGWLLAAIVDEVGSK